jgi:multicomponent Na+:H+ antiporter subunit G
MTEWLTAGLILISTAFMLLAAVGIVRMPDVYLRLQVTTKASTLGSATVLLAVAVYFGTVPLATRALLGMVFLAMTQPIAAHMIGRAAYILRAPLWEGTHIDELRQAADRRPDAAASFGSEGEQPGASDPR